MPQHRDRDVAAGNPMSTAPSATLLMIPGR
jgi:hypothetical protein